MATSFEPIMFSDLTEKTTAPSDADIIVIEDPAATKKAKWSNLINWIKAKLNIGSADISSIGDGTVTGAINTLNTKITYKKWCEENGMTNILDKAPEGLSFWSANPNNKPAVGMPSGFLEYGTYIIFKGSEYPVLLYVSVTGEAATWGTNNGAWKILS